MTNDNLGVNKKTKLEPQKLKTFFIDHLNLVYCCKAHLLERLAEVIDDASFADLKYAITETMEDAEQQLLRIDEIYTILEIEPSLANCNSFITLIDEAFNHIQQKGSDPQLRDLSILFYMQNIESMEMASFKVLQITAEKLNNANIGKLLQQCFDEVTGDKALLLFILTKYIAA